MDEKLTLHDVSMQPLTAFNKIEELKGDLNAAKEEYKEYRKRAYEKFGKDAEEIRDLQQQLDKIKKYTNHSVACEKWRSNGIRECSCGLEEMLQEIDLPETKKEANEPK